MALLEIENLVAGYGKIEILHGISLALEEGTLCAIVANGAGKSTLLRAVLMRSPKLPAACALPAKRSGRWPLIASPGAVWPTSPRDAGCSRA